MGNPMRFKKVDPHNPGEFYDLNPGTWRFPHFKDVFAERRGVKVYITCPNGHDSAMLSHKIDEQGRISPSVVCPMKDCGFHEYGTLENWNANTEKSDKSPKIS